MKNRSQLLFVSVILLVLFSGFFSWFRHRYAVAVPEPSHLGGYYENEFLLTLTAPANGTIYYTLDGSEPTASSQKYSDGIYLQDRSQEPNRYLSRKNLIKNWLGYEPDPAPVPKATVLRAIYVNSLGVCSDVLTQTYFIGIAPPEVGYTLSLIGDEDAIFGSDGLYVTGTEYDNWLISGASADTEPTPNFNKRMEVPVIAEFFLNSSGNSVNWPVSLRLQGNSMRGALLKRFIMESSAELSGSNVFPFEVFPGTATHSLMTKDNAIDAMIHELVSDRNVATTQSVPVSVYINGEFFYRWYLLERYDNQYFQQHYGVDNTMLIKNAVPDPDVPESAGAYGEMMYWIAHTDYSDPDQWEQLNKEVDIQSYIDYISINYYLCNWDFSDDKNCLLWRSVEQDTTAYGDCRWRWCIYDIDAIDFSYRKFDMEPAEINIFSCELPYSPVKVNETVLFRALREHPEFRQQFVLSFMDIVNNNFSSQRVEQILRNHNLDLSWHNGFFEKRPAYAAAHLAEEFGLSGSLETVTVTSDQPSMGSVCVNTSVIDLSSGSWTGSYFTDYPITLTALPKEGYEFIGWKGAATGSEQMLTVPVDGGITLEAVFARTE